MKRSLLLLAAFALTAAQAQVTNAPNAKADPKSKQAAAAAPAAAKPKEKLMTRDELRACMDQREANDQEAVAINADMKAYKLNSEGLKTEHDRLEAATVSLNARTAAAKAEYDAIVKENEAFKAAAPKMEKADFEAKKKELTDRGAAFEAARDKIVADSKQLNAEKDALGTNIDKNNVTFKSLEDRRDAQLDKVDDWKAQCSKKKYDENDEIAINKERAAKAKAAAAAAAASAPAK
jgi:hypothetical protein